MRIINRKSSILLLCIAVAGLVQAIEFKEIDANIKAMTSAQFDAFMNPLLGSRVYWKGWVNDVEAAVAGQCKVLINMDNPANGYSCYDVVIYLPDYKAMKLKLKEPITFNGKIEKVSKFIGATVTLSDVQ
jgi:hypothetical protein